MIKENSLILFQGDSITDCGRDYTDGSHLGYGYPMMTAAAFNAAHPELNVKFLNRGISGNRVVDLKARWEKDCLELNPDIVSILIGINDTWRGFDSNDPTTAEAYYDGYRVLLQSIKDRLDAQIVICEPFVLAVTDDQKNKWREDLDPKINAARALAREFKAVYIPFDGVFAAVSTVQPPEYWAADGVHPTHAGHALMSKHWLEAVKTI